MADEASHSRRHILVVDDNVDSADSWATMLRLPGNEVDVAYDGDEALRLADERRPDVILLDLGLPGQDGYEVCRAIRSRPWSRPMTLIAVTGWDGEDDRRRSREAGFDLHLVKPVAPEALLQLLAELAPGRAREEPS
jgi:CheY-like chemotaxis protein